MLFTTFQSGTMVGANNRYRIEALLGEGGGGRTYLATDQHLSNRYCVIKRPLVEVATTASERKALLQNFEREAQLLVTLNAPGHRSIPPIYDYLSDSFCLVMKYIAGLTLDKVMRQRGGTLPETDALLYVRAVCDALVYMHTHASTAILHRDIKPSNIILDTTGEVWVIDFGLSKATPIQKVAGLAQNTRGSGTLGYTPVEQWLGKAVPQSDMYALAATLHELLTGYPSPVTEQDVVAVVTMRKATLPKLPPVRRLVPTLKVEVERLIEQLLLDTPAARPTAAEVRASLDAMLKPAEAPKVIQAPTGEPLADEQQLAVWCERHWDTAADYMYGLLPSQVEMFWARNKLAHDIRDIVAQHADRDAGVDALIRLLDPQFPAPQVQISPTEINYGSLSIDQRAKRTITLTNSGRGYAVLQLRGSAWLSPDLREVGLRAGATQQVEVSANMTNQLLGGTLQADLQIVIPAGQMQTLPAHARLPRWRTISTRAGRALAHGTRVLTWHLRHDLPVFGRISWAIIKTIAMTCAVVIALVILLIRIIYNGLGRGIYMLVNGAWVGALGGAVLGGVSTLLLGLLIRTSDAITAPLVHYTHVGLVGLLVGGGLGAASGAVSGSVVATVVEGLYAEDLIGWYERTRRIVMMSAMLLGAIVVYVLMRQAEIYQSVLALWAWGFPSASVWTTVVCVVAGAGAGLYAGWFYQRL